MINLYTKFNYLFNFSSRKFFYILGYVSFMERLSMAIPIQKKL